ncbi:hypothetical protein EDB19DRAFT_1825307 [Suillus lakei]|nr:hypothetical protein EDB19DRAFT_1825307 [Suillus lakei]
MQATVRPGKQQKLSIQPKDKTTGRKGKVQEPPRVDGPLPPCDRCQAKNVECCPQLTKKGDVALTCLLCHLWKMACIQTNAESATITPTTNTAPPVATVATHSKMTWSKATGKKMGRKSKAKGKDIQHPSPIQEEEDNVDDVRMVGASILSQQPAPLASTNNFPPDHWIEPSNDKMPPPSPVSMSMPLTSSSIRHTQSLPVMSISHPDSSFTNYCARIALPSLYGPG